MWDRLMDAITKAHDGMVQMIDTSSRVAQPAREREVFVGGARSFSGVGHQHQDFGLRQVDRLLASTDSDMNGVSIGRPGQMLPASGDGDQVVGPAAQLLADVVDQKVEITARTNYASQDTTCHRWEWEKGGGKNLQVVEAFSGKGTR